MANMDERKSQAKQYNLKFEPIVFPQQTQPHGYLVKDLRCQGCWYYYLLARKMYEQETTGVVYEGDVHIYKYDELLLSVSLIYGFMPDELTKFWELVEQECTRLNLPQLPHKIRYHARKHTSLLI